MKILNGYAGIGGNRKLWEGHDITAIEYKKDIAEIYKHYFPKDRIIITDAHEYLLKHISEYDFVWMSPPCPTHSKFRQMAVYRGQNTMEYPDMSLYQEILLLKYFAPKSTKWVVENVSPYYSPLIKPSVALGRHYFWTNFYVRKKDFSEDGTLDHVTNGTTKYGFSISDFTVEDRKNK